VSEVVEITIVGLMEVSITQADGGHLDCAQDIEMLVSLYFLKGLVSLARLSGFKQCSITYLILIAEGANPSTVNWYLQGEHGLFREPSKHHTVSRSVAVLHVNFHFLSKFCAGGQP